MANSLSTAELKTAGQEEFRTGAGDAKRRQAAIKETLEAERNRKEGEYVSRNGTDFMDSNLVALKVLRNMVQGRLDYDEKAPNGDPNKTTIEFRNVASTGWNRGDPKSEYGASFANYRRLDFQANIAYMPKELVNEMNGKLKEAGAKDAELFNPDSSDRKVKNRKVTLHLAVGINTPRQVTLGDDGSARPDRNSGPMDGLFSPDSKAGKQNPNLTIDAANSWLAGEPALALNAFGKEKRQIEAIEKGAGDMPISTLVNHSNKDIANLARADGQKQYLDVVAGYGQVQDFGDTGKRGVAAGGVLNFSAKALLKSLDKTIALAESQDPRAPSANVNPKDGKPSPTTKRGNVTIDMGYVSGSAVSYTRPLAKPRQAGREDAGIEFGTA